MQKKEIATYVEQAIITFQTNNCIKKKTVLQQDDKNFKISTSNEQYYTATVQVFTK